MDALRLLSLLSEYAESTDAMMCELSVEQVIDDLLDTIPLAALENADRERLEALGFNL